MGSQVREDKGSRRGGVDDEEPVLTEPSSSAPISFHEPRRDPALPAAYASHLAVVPFWGTTNTVPPDGRSSMALSIDPALSALFGSANRVRTLAPLANSLAPLTAYRIAKMVDVPRTKVYDELAGLAAMGWVSKVVTTGTGSRWELRDLDVRRLLRRRARIVSIGDITAASDGVATGTRAILARSRRNPIDSALLRGPFQPRDPEDFARPAEKDAGLRRMGLPVSRRARPAP
ncbi:MAG: helix-turn-helix domain-containing protein [Thermoplasmata archaeon]